ncbi:hypothetical protein B0T20DRAFT_392429 [Sordaria brevicollis]|uniref:Uncharacterized protein n=1 Tax=Sordaria brevicollis TaxID=83679 RepID=A0AAE0UDG8_SORBR|nr:hypothetical protein B0T20DRAFT_392429 [Sordaria brevicollis]
MTGDTGIITTSQSPTSLAVITSLSYTTTSFQSTSDHDTIGPTHSTLHTKQLRLDTIFNTFYSKQEHFWVVDMEYDNDPTNPQGSVHPPNDMAQGIEQPYGNANVEPAAGYGPSPLACDELTQSQQNSGYVNAPGSTTGYQNEWHPDGLVGYNAGWNGGQYGPIPHANGHHGYNPVSYDPTPQDGAYGSHSHNTAFSQPGNGATPMAAVPYNNQFHSAEGAVPNSGSHHPGRQADPYIGHSRRIALSQHGNGANPMAAVPYNNQFHSAEGAIQQANNVVWGEAYSDLDATRYNNSHIGNNNTPMGMINPGGSSTSGNMNHTNNDHFAYQARAGSITTPASGLTPAHTTGPNAPGTNSPNPTGDAGPATTNIANFPPPNNLNVMPAGAANVSHPVTSGSAGQSIQSVAGPPGGVPGLAPVERRRPIVIDKVGLYACSRCFIPGLTTQGLCGRCRNIGRATKDRRRAGIPPARGIHGKGRRRGPRKDRDGPSGGQGMGGGSMATA